MIRLVRLMRATLTRGSYEIVQFSVLCTAKGVIGHVRYSRCAMAGALRQVRCAKPRQVRYAPALRHDRCATASVARLIKSVKNFYSERKFT